MRIVAAIVIRDGKMFLQRRKRGNIFVLEFPCGKVEDQESFVEAAQRELMEEADLHSEFLNKQILLKASDGQSDIAFVLLKTPENQHPKMTDPRREQTFYWMRPEDIPTNELPAADAEFIFQYLNGKIC